MTVAQTDGMERTPIIGFVPNSTVPQSMDQKCIFLKIHTQIEEWDDGRNPQFLLFVDGQAVQGQDMNHREKFA